MTATLSATSSPDGTAPAVTGDEVLDALEALVANRFGEDE